MGSSLTTSEEISCNGLVYGHERTMDIAGYLPEEKAIAMQLVGSDIAALAKAAKILEAQGADIIDLNMGCPVPKITKTGAGAALLRDPMIAARTMRAIRTAIKIPFTVKIRGGWDDSTVNAPEIAKIAESEGVNAICVHPRTRSQQYSGFAPWEIIRLVVEAVKIPVTGNGDVKSFADAHRMQAETGCQSVMIGRGALGRPWIFDPEYETLSPEEQRKVRERVIRRHFDLIEEHSKNPGFAAIQMKKHLAWYTVGTPGAAKVRQRVFQLSTVPQIRELFESYWDGSFHLGNTEDDSVSDAIATSSKPAISPAAISSET
jgi:tRNA-dihydrouridine synthase B